MNINLFRWGSHKVHIYGPDQISKDDSNIGRGVCISTSKDDSNIGRGECISTSKDDSKLAEEYVLAQVKTTVILTEEYALAQSKMPSAGHLNIFSCFHQNKFEMWFPDFHLIYLCEW